MTLELITSRGLVTHDVLPHSQTATICNNSLAEKKVLVEIPLHAWETGQTVQLSQGTSVTSTTGAYSATLTLPPASKAELAIYSLYGQPVDLQGEPLETATATKTITVTCVEIGGVAVENPEPILDILSTAWLGTGVPKFCIRPANGGVDTVALMAEFFCPRNPQESAKILDWIEGGCRNLADLICLYEKLAQENGLA